MIKITSYEVDYTALDTILLYDGPNWRGKMTIEAETPNEVLAIANAVMKVLDAGLRQLDPERFSNAGASIGDAKATAMKMPECHNTGAARDLTTAMKAGFKPSRMLQEAATPWPQETIAERVDSVWQRALKRVDEERALDRFWVLLGCGVAAAVGLATLGRWAVDAVWQAF